MAVFLLCQNGAGTMSLNSMPRLSAPKLKQLSSEIEEGISRFVDGERWTVAVKDATRSIRRNVIEGVTAHWHARAFTLAFTLAAQELVASANELLSRCTGCGEVFVRDDLRQAYCDAKCAVNARMRKHRGKRPAKPKHPVSSRKMAPCEWHPTP